MPQKLRHIEYRAHPHRRARKRDENQRPRKVAHLAEYDISATVDDIADHDGALVVFKTDVLAQTVGNERAHDQSDATAAPDRADARRTALKHDFAEEAEENLRSAAARGPSHRDPADAENQRAFAHV